MQSYVPILVFVLVSIGFIVVMLLVAKLLRHHGDRAHLDRSLRVRQRAGELRAQHRFSIRYYLIAVLFVVFDVETVFLYPWAVMFDQLALFGFIEMMVFLVILLIGYAYVWRRGALQWA